MKQSIEALSPEDQDRITEAFGDEMRTVLPAGWRCAESHDNAALFLGPGLVSVIVEVEMHENRDLWIHVSASKKAGRELPSWSELSTVKELFIGAERAAVQILPKKSEHFSMFEVLHLFAPIGRELPLPDMRRVDGGL